MRCLAYKSYYTRKKIAMLFEKLKKKVITQLYR